ncbi:FkbM family methyltransferase [Aestuariivirga sp.]|uniref:FkbM family methyltransferase n=1 Tax=Aestuariivirga sp. TaxID=2650926 RepID=UPI003BA8F3D7
MKIVFHVRGVVERAIRMFTTPGMSSMFIRWCFHSHGRRITILPGVSVGELMSFSEFWSFRAPVSSAERRFVKDLFSNTEGTGVAVDAGANIGSFTLLFASLGAKVHSFEPVPQTFVRLLKNIAFNGLDERCSPICAALGQRNGIANFDIDETSSATNRAAVEDNAGNMHVAVFSLDEYCHRLCIERIDLLKVDVEGMEPDVLRGASCMLKERRIKSILIEICHTNLRSSGYSVAQLHSEIVSRGYGAYRLEGSGALGPILECSDLEAMTLENVVLLPLPNQMYLSTAPQSLDSGTRSEHFRSQLS